LRKPIPGAIFIIIGMISGVAAASAIFAATGFSIFGERRGNAPGSDGINNAHLTALAFEVLGHIKDSDFESLSEVAHPDFGVVFSPSATINLSTNMRFSAEQIALFSTDGNIYVWGTHNDTGEPIRLTPAEYFAQFVFSSDYFNASILGIDRIIRSGNALENISDEFPGIRFVDFHIPDADRGTQDDLDWSSLRLGFEERDERLWLTVIVHSTWTV